MNTLISAYINDIHRAAKSARVIDREDAEMVAIEKFMIVARMDKGRNNERLAGFVSRAMVNAVMNADAEASAVRIPPDTLRRYFNLVRDTGSIEAAYVACKDAANNFDPITLLAVSHALNSESIEALQAANYTGRVEGNEFYATNGRDSQDWERNSQTPSHEEAVVQTELVKYLFAQTSSDSETILRLSYGFSDEPSQALRLVGEYPQDACLSDAQISPLVERSRASVQRARVEALRTMHASILAASTD